ncbi:CARDB domain-containing protein [Actinomycetospora cinnamomea]|uniref:CARDB domain-containing protein n=1 Tax=Actinomycetospora cinnamomea TaxID=663609 RepID=UPI000E315A8F|nr:CARDB domain-containing protein [Actinomycetospora cinnamomea]
MSMPGRAKRPSRIYRSLQRILAATAMVVGLLVVPVVTADAAVGPDLTPTRITFDGSSLRVGNAIYFDSGVSNLGDAWTGVFNIKWLVDGAEVGAYGSHNGVPAGTRVVDGNSQFSWSFNRGCHDVEFLVDADNHVSESVEYNNKGYVNVCVD